MCIRDRYHSFLWSKVKLKDNPFRKEITQGLLLALFYEIYNLSLIHIFLLDGRVNTIYTICDRLHELPEHTAILMGTWRVDMNLSLIHI